MSNDKQQRCQWCGDTYEMHTDEKPTKAVLRVPCLTWKGGFLEKNTKPQQECCEECFKWGDKYGEYKHPCHNTDCECHTPQQDTGWEEQFDEMIEKHIHEYHSYFDDMKMLKDFIAQEKAISEQQGYQRGLQEALEAIGEDEDTSLSDLDPQIHHMESNSIHRQGRNELRAELRKKLSEKKGGK